MYARALQNYEFLFHKLTVKEFDKEYSNFCFSVHCSPALLVFCSSIRQIQTHQFNSSTGLLLHSIQKAENKYIGVFSGDCTTGHKKLLFPIVSIV